MGYRRLHAKYAGKEASLCPNISYNTKEKPMDGISKMIVFQ